MNYIYLDNAATTKQHPLVTAEINRVSQELFYNAAALYTPSLSVKQHIEQARKIILNKLSMTGEGELVFTSGATESNNMVILGKASKHGKILLLEGEHSSAHTPAKFLGDNGYDVEMIPLDKLGRADLSKLKTAPNIGSSVTLVFGLVNSDTGTIQDAKSIVQAVRAMSPNAHIHCDATQAFCKIPFDVESLGFDSVAISAHKIGGPKGIGALWIKKGVNIKQLMFGGGQQALRPGTENNPGVAGFAKAVEVFDTNTNWKNVSQLHTHLVTNLPKDCTINGINNNPYITNIGLPNNIMGQTAMNALATDGILVGLGSACASNASKNRTLVAMGIQDQKTKQVLRISFSPDNTIADVDIFIKKLKETLAKL